MNHRLLVVDIATASASSIACEVAHGRIIEQEQYFMYQVSIVYLPVPVATDDHHLLKLQAVWHRRVSLQKQLKTRGGKKI